MISMEMMDEPGDHRHERDERPRPRMIVCYIAGPLEGSGRPLHNMARAAVVAADLMDRGFVPLVPHASLVLDMIAPRPREMWLACDLVLLSRCDVLYRMPGHSPGADEECARAFALGIPVVYSVASLMDLARSVSPASYPACSSTPLPPPGADAGSDAPASAPPSEARA